MKLTTLSVVQTLATVLVAAVWLGSGTHSSADLGSELGPERAERLATNPRIDSELLAALANDGEIEIVVIFEEPALRGAREVHPLVRRRAIADRASALTAAAKTRGFWLRHQLRELPVIAGRATRDAIERLASMPEVTALGIDSRVYAHLGQSIPQTGLDRLHGVGKRGSGVHIAFLDTGIDSAHADLEGALLEEQCFCSGGCCPDFSSRQQGPGAAADGRGHGTQVAGILASIGDDSAVGGAPAAGLIAVKVLSDDGVGAMSDVAAGLDWIRSEAPEVAIVNLSLGSGLVFPGACDNVSAETKMLSAAIGALHDAGVLVVASAGNDGSGLGITSPACIRDAVAVGAVWDANLGRRSDLDCTDATTEVDQVTCWSNSGPEVDLLAPGGLVRTDRLGGGTTNAVGTSFAAPHVAACAALLFEAEPDLDPDSLAVALLTSPTLVVDDKNQRARPRLDCQAALTSLPEPSATSVLATLSTLVTLRALRTQSRRSGATSRSGASAR